MTLAKKLKSKKLKSWGLLLIVASLIPELVLVLVGLFIVL